MSCNNAPLRGRISSKFDPPLVVETPSHRAAIERPPRMICIERIGMVRPAGWSSCGSSPTVLPSRRGRDIIGRQLGVTFESELTLRKAPSKPSSSFRGSMSRIFTSNVAPHLQHLTENLAHLTVIPTSPCVSLLSICRVSSYCHVSEWLPTASRLRAQASLSFVSRCR